MSDIAGAIGVGGEAINLQYDPFNQATFVNFGVDAEGEVVSLTLTGLNQSDWSSIDLA